MRWTARFRLCLSLVAGLLVWALVTPSHAQTVTVPGTADIFAAGLSQVPGFGGGGGTLPPSVAVTGGSTVTVNATGLTNCCSSTPDSPPDGTTGFAQTTINSAGGLSGIVAPRAMFLVGVFLGLNPPAGFAPPNLNFSSIGTDFGTLAPVLQQVFYIGSGQTSRGLPHSFIVPAGATRLFLGFADAFSFSGNPGFYDDNRGSLTATVRLGAAVGPTPTPTPVPPLAVFASASTTGGFAPLTVGFAASVSGGTPPFTFSWTFGDGGTSNAQNPTYTFGSAGSFTVRVVATDAGGQSASATVSVSVTTPTPTPTPSPIGGGSTLQFTANNTSVGVGDRLVMTLITSPPPGASVVDLYAALRLPGGAVLFFSGDPFNPFLSSAAPFRRALTVMSTSFEVLNIVIPDRIPPGTYTFLAAYIRQGRPPTITEIIGQLAQIDVTIGSGPALPPTVSGACSGTVQLFSARPTVPTGEQTSPSAATVTGTATQSISFPSGARAVLSSTPDGTGPFIVDNFLTINGTNACPGGGNCFASVIDTSITVVGLPIGQALRPIPPVDVSTLIPRGTTSVVFETRDYGVIAGNTDIYLVLTGPGCGATGEGGVGSIGGRVTDSQTGNPLAGASITVGASGGSAVTDADGTFTIPNVPIGSVQVTASFAGYISASRTVTVGPNQTASANLALSPRASLGTGQVRVVLSWGREPRDLDAHLTGPARPNLEEREAPPASARFHVFYASRGSLTSDPDANLDRDNTSGGNNGPETITIAQVRPGVYRYSVHDFTNRGSTTSSALSQSEATVAVFFGSQQVASFEVPKSRPGTLWTVFELEGTQIRPINSMRFNSDPFDITKFVLAPIGEDPALFNTLPAK